ncbi:thiol:disulfide interchange protein DsbA/DsbL [Immundisolibacter sp.]|uniref:thiol:disulfide interchange protein DsbA/DsbL n=1 Tax=Immundisolibacter sp. TaxID=1934948 RepID=UPI002637C924|nr:thiol:disulfide interchange protein DsbA/DsbL [Immundisolibacter sp.]MDD3650626.1 thiol:disulfide interchange protein DsbA/DsbL [Immundisolibacter sp.]
MRTPFMRLPLLTGLLVLLLATFGAVHAEPWAELPQAQPTRNPAKVEVIEFFWYGCPHCYAVEPRVAQWAKRQPATVEFIRIPAVFNQRWAVLGRAYYAMQQLKLGDDAHRALFDAIHRDHKNLSDEASLAEFFAGLGVSKEKFHEAFTSFDVDSKVGRANRMTAAYGLEGVPTFIVNGKYRIDGTTAGSEEGMFIALDQLVARELKALGTR